MTRYTALLLSAALSLASAASHALPSMGAPQPPPETPVKAHPPLYLGGVVSTVLWGEPHARMELQLDADQVKPGDLESRIVQRPSQDMQKARMMVRQAINVPGEWQWRVVMVPLSRMSLLDMPRPAVGDRVGVVGYPVPARKGDPSVMAYLLVIGGVAYPVRFGEPPALSDHPLPS